jgi:GGDEF domain-containing protein
MQAMLVDRRTPARLLAVLYAVSGALCLVTAIWPMHRDTPVPLLWALAVTGIAGGAAIWTLRFRLRGWTVHVAVAVYGVLIALLAWRSATAVGIVGLGPAVIAAGLYAAHFFDLPAARLHAALLVVLTTAGALAARPAGFAASWVTIVVSVVALTEAQGRLAQNLRTAAHTDPLTGVANRRAWEAEAVRHLSRAVLRQADLLGRYGGDEFVLCLPATDEDGARQILQQLDTTHDFAWSVGVATARPGDTLSTVLARADGDLYLMKRGGRAA